MLSVQFYKQKVPTRSALPRLWRWKGPLPPIPPYPHTPIHLITNHLRFAPVSCRRFPRAHQSPGEGIQPRRLGSLSCRRLPARRLEQRTSHGRYCLRLDQPSPDHKPGLLPAVPRDIRKDDARRYPVARVVCRAGLLYVGLHQRFLSTFRLSLAGLSAPLHPYRGVRNWRTESVRQNAGVRGRNWRFGQLNRNNIGYQLPGECAVFADCADSSARLSARTHLSPAHSFGIAAPAQKEPFCIPLATLTADRTSEDARI